MGFAFDLMLIYNSTRLVAHTPKMRDKVIL